jgi:hypothetical protein
VRWLRLRAVALSGALDVRICKHSVTSYSPHTTGE